jgi:hypothetical protein
MIRFLTAKEIWPRITELAKKTKKAHVAVAYFGQDARQLLPLRSGSVLVVDCHPKSVKGGRTCPHDLLALIKKKVEVHSCSNLHAKVFVFGNRAIIGSANASKLSRNYLLEAAVETTDKETVAECLKFINSLRGDQISPKYAKRRCKIWNPPKIAGLPTKPDQSPRFHPLWVVPLVLKEWDEVDDRQDAQAEPVAQKKLKDRKRFLLDKFHWHGGDKLGATVKVGHQLLQVLEEGNSQWVSPPSRCSVETPVVAEASNWA